MRKQIATHIKTVNPTPADNVAAGFGLGQEWLNTTTGNRFYHKTNGVWKSVVTTDIGTASQFVKADGSLDSTVYEPSANKQNTLAYDGGGNKFATVDAINTLASSLAKVGTKTGLLSKKDTFDLLVLDNFTARISAVEGCIFWNEIFVPATPVSNAIKSFPQKDYPLTQLVTATGGNVNVAPIVTDGIYVRYLGYDKDGNVYSDVNNFTSSNDIFQIGFVTVLKTGGVVNFLGGITAGARNVFPQPSLASNTEFDKVAATSTDVAIAANAAANFKTLSGSIVGISVNWKGLTNPGNANPIDTLPYVGQTTPTFVSIDPTFLTQTLAPTTHTAWTETEGGIAINNSFFNTTTGLRGTMNNGTASIKRVLLGVRGGLFLQEGDHAAVTCYADLATAKNNIYNHTFTNAIIPPGVVIEIARIAYVKGVTNLADTAQAYIVNTTSGAGAGASGSINVLSGTWTPTITNSVAGIVTVTSVKSSYERVGNIVTANYGFTLSANTGLCTFTITLPFSRAVSTTFPLGSGTLQYASGFTPVYVDSNTVGEVRVSFSAPSTVSYSGSITFQYTAA